MLETRLSLIDRLRDPNDAGSWNEFVNLYRPLLVNYVRKQGAKLGMQPSDVDDAVQEVLIALARRLPTFHLDHDRARFRTYLWRTTYHAVINWLRRERRNHNERQLDDKIAALQEASDGQPDEEWANSHHRRVLHYATEKVRRRTPETKWACFKGHLIQGRPAAEVASELDVSANLVYVNCSRVLKDVREQCREYLEELSDA